MIDDGTGLRERHVEALREMLDGRGPGASFTRKQGRAALTAAIAALSAVAPPPVLEGTPSSRWSANGEPDPHGDRYACERAALAMGDMTDDELANAVYLHGDATPSMSDLMSGKAVLPTAYLTAAKDRIRWLSRKLAASPAAPAQPAMQAAPVANGMVRLSAIQAALESVVPPKMTESRAEYWKAGARATVDAINGAIRAERK